MEKPAYQKRKENKAKCQEKKSSLLLKGERQSCYRQAVDRARLKHFAACVTGPAQTYATIHQEQNAAMLNRPNDPRPETASTPVTTGSGAFSPAASRTGQEGPRGQLRSTPPAPARRVVDMPGTAPAVRRPPVDGPRYGQGEGRRMVVARDITLAGQISKCDTLIVEGAVEGMRYDGQSLEVAEGGSFNGSIEVDTAEIAGTFEGVVVVRGRLSVRPTGRIVGTVRYGEIEINAGGQINGELQSMQTSPARSVMSASSSSLDDAEDDTSTTAETSAASAS